MKTVFRRAVQTATCLVVVCVGGGAARAGSFDPASPVMLAGPWVPADPHQIDFDHLPKIPSQHAVVSDVRPSGGHRVNQHNYLVHFDGKFWAMWSDGPGESRGPNRVPGHDRADQHVSFATSPDGLVWSDIGTITGRPDPGFGWIARGFWIREGKLLALASRYQAPGYSGAGLSLQAFELSGDVNGKPDWRRLGMVFDDSLNNFSPAKLPSGEWMMSRRDGKKDVHFLVGGVKGFDQWESYPVVGYSDSELKAEEPYWWVLPDGNIAALFRDNGNSGYLFRSFSMDNGRSWSRPVRTNFPDAKSKFSGVRLKDGRYLLVSNPRPKVRDPLTLAISRDGLVFHAMGYLDGGRHLDYPHVIEHEGYVFVAYATIKQTVEVLRIDVKELAKLEQTQSRR